MEAANNTKTKTVRLPGGGRVTLNYDLDLFQEDESDIEWVLRIVKQFKDYNPNEHPSHMANHVTTRELVIGDVRE